MKKCIKILLTSLLVVTCLNINNFKKDVFALDQYTVTFDTQIEGDTSKSITVDSDSLIEKPTDPICSGYTFVAWYKESTCENVWNFDSDTVTSNITLYAGWLENYTVTFNMNGHGTAIDSQSITSGYTIAEPYDPVCEGYAFAGWYKEDTCENVWDFEDGVTSDTTLYAKWVECIAEVGDTYCTNVEDFKDAFNSINGDATINLQADIDLSSNCLTMVNGQNITLNLNGYELKSSATQVIDIKGGNLTINDTDEGKITGSNRVIYCENQTEINDLMDREDKVYNNDNNSNIVINGGTFTGNKYAIYANQGCNLTINGGTFISTSTNTSMPYAAVRIFCNGNFVINGGTFVGTRALSADYSNDYGKANVVVNGGTFTGDIYYFRGTLNIYGGNYSVDVNDYCAQGLRTKKLDDDRYVVLPWADADPIAENKDTGVKYQTINEAVAASSSGDTIYLLNDEKENVIIPEDKNITLDLKGKWLKSESGTTLYNKGIVNVVDTDEDYLVYIYANDAESSNNVCVYNEGEMSLTSDVRLSGYINILNVVNGKLDSDATTESSSFGLIMNGGQVSVGKNAAICITANDNDDKASVMVNNGNLILNGGTIGDENKLNGIMANNTSDIVINDGKVLGSKYGLSLSGSSDVNINDGFINGGQTAIYTSGNSFVSIKGGTIYSKLWYGIDTYDYSKVTIDDGTIYGFECCVEANNNSVILSNSGTFGTYYDSDDETTHISNSSFYLNDDAKVTVNNGYYKNINGIFALGSSELNINGGYFKSTGEYGVINAADDFTGKINVASGLFSHSFSGKYLAKYYELVNNTDAATKDEYPYAVTKMSAVKIVQEKISAIGTVTYTSECKTRIDDARSAYNALTTKEKAKITTEQLKVLTDAESKYAELKKKAEEQSSSSSSSSSTTIEPTKTITVKSTTAKTITLANGDKKKTISTTESLITKTDGTELREITTKENSNISLVAASNIIPTGTSLSEKELDKDSSEYNEVIDNSGLNLDDIVDIFIYNFDLTESNGVEIHELDDYVEVSLPVPDGIELKDGQHIAVYLVNDDGSLTECEAAVKDGIITFKTNHFSTYIFAIENDTQENDAPINETTIETNSEVTETSSSISFNISPAIIGGIVGVAIVVIVLLKIKKRK